MVGSIIVRVRGEINLTRRLRGIATLLANVLAELDDLAQAVQIQQMWRGRRRDRLRGRRGVGPTHCDGGVETIRESHDEIGVRAAADANHLDLLAAEGMMWMGNRHKSRRRLG